MSKGHFTATSGWELHLRRPKAAVCQVVKKNKNICSSLHLKAMIRHFKKNTPTIPKCKTNHTHTHTHYHYYHKPNHHLNAYSVLAPPVSSRPLSVTIRSFSLLWKNKNVGEVEGFIRGDGRRCQMLHVTTLVFLVFCFF